MDMLMQMLVPPESVLVDPRAERGPVCMWRNMPVSQIAHETWDVRTVMDACNVLNEITGWYKW